MMPALRSQRQPRGCAPDRPVAPAVHRAASWLDGGCAL